MAQAQVDFAGSLSGVWQHEQRAWQRYVTLDRGSPGLAWADRCPPVAPVLNKL